MKFPLQCFPKIITGTTGLLTASDSGQDGIGGRDKTKGPSIINTVLLVKPFCKKTRFVTLDCTCFIPFDFINPFTIDNINRVGTRNKYPCTVLDKCLIILYHSVTR
ncbi:hypothetical protein HanHA89_Chr11g0412821 [Helianthus annuus]|nr:hypothetical protein HanHA89_Chr11g0412821 [Helianthus annuus]